MTAAPRRKDDSALLMEIAGDVSRRTGVQFTEKNFPMLKARLVKRLGDLGLSDLEEYGLHFAKHRREELEHLVSLLTTHHTFFFREYAHFEFVEQNLSVLVDRVRREGRREIRIWSAACSLGHEAYSLAMFLDARLKSKYPDISFRILGTDVDPQSVRFAENGVYRWSEGARIPVEFLNRYWRRGTGSIAEFMKVAPELRARCEFRPSNLMESSEYPAEQSFDLILCRNVFIYFALDRVQTIAADLRKRLKPGGWLMIGLSETVPDPLKAGLEHIGKSVFRIAKSPAALSVAHAPEPAPAVIEARPLRVICVDDSPTVLTMVRKMLSGKDGFAVVGTAGSGKEAHELLKTTAADVMILDIHMPHMTGIEYLSKHFHKGHIPVIMMSSVSRDDAGLALRALELGASDYVEKPSLQNMAQVADELTAKIKMAVSLKDQARSGLATSGAFAHRRQIARPERFLVGVALTASEMDRVQGQMSLLSPGQPPLILIVTDDAGQIASRARERAWRSVPANAHDLRPGEVYWADPAGFERIVNERRPERLCVWSVGRGAKAPLRWPPGSRVKWLVEEAAGAVVTANAGVEPSVFPLTSFAYESDRWLSEES